jgi:hypothetical protein
MVYLICVVSVVAPSFSPARAALTGGATSTITSGALHREVYNLHTNISSFLLGVNCDSDSGGGREAGGRQERRDEGNWAQEWGRVETGGGCVVG